ncbi:MAG: type VI secretion system baseplate subunit TssG [Comamonadaceae bacterium]|nr:type VI secretion system baseplate subunit TssG [Comamonadaceae bacterium]
MTPRRAPFSTCSHSGWPRSATGAWARAGPRCRPSGRGTTRCARCCWPSPASRRRRTKAADGAAVAFHAAALQRRRSADSVERDLSHWFDVPVRLQPWAGGWHALPRDDLARLGSGAATLGHDAVLGSRVRQCDLRVRLAIGPLDRDGLDALLPGAGGLGAPLRRWLDGLLGDAVEVEVRLVLRAADVVPARLAGGPADTAPRLGFDAYLLSRRAEVDRDDAGYLLFAAP